MSCTDKNVRRRSMVDPALADALRPRTAHIPNSTMMLPDVEPKGRRRGVGGGSLSARSPRSRGVSAGRRQPRAAESPSADRSRSPHEEEPAPSTLARATASVYDHRMKDGQRAAQPLLSSSALAPPMTLEEFVAAPYYSLPSNVRSVPHVQTATALTAHRHHNEAERQAAAAAALTVPQRPRLPWSANASTARQARMSRATASFRGMRLPSSAPVGTGRAASPSHHSQPQRQGDSRKPSDGRRESSVRSEVSSVFEELAQRFDAGGDYPTLPRHSANLDDPTRLDGFECVGKSLETLFARFQADDEAAEAVLDGAGAAAEPCATRRTASGKASQKWRLLAEWIDRYHVDDDAHATCEACFEVFHDRYAVDREEAAPHPHKPSTAVGLAVLDELLRLLCAKFPRFESVCDAVKREVWGAVYLDPPPPPRVEADAPEEGPIDAAIRRIEAQASRAAERRTFYTYVQDALERVRRVEQKLYDSKSMAVRQIRVVDRVVGYWKLEFQKVVLKVWRNWFRSLGRDVEEQEEKEQLQDQVDRLHEAVAMRDHDMAQMQAEFAAQTRQYQAALASREHMVETLKAELQALKKRNYDIKKTNQAMANDALELQQFIQKKTDESNTLRALLEKTVSCYLEGPVLERARRENFRSLLGDGAGGDGITDWFFNASMFGSGFSAPKPIAGIAKCDDILSLSTASSRIGDYVEHYLYIMRFISPDTVPEQDLRDAIEARDDRRALDFFCRHCAALGILLPFDADELAVATHHQLLAYHVTIVAALFARFVDSGTCGEWVDADEGVQAAPVDQDEFKARIEAAWADRCYWRTVADRTRKVAMAIVLKPKHSR